MQDNQIINKARALYYNFFANFFVVSPKSENYFELIKLLNILKENPLDESSAEALTNISKLLDSSSNVALLQEFDDLFHNPLTFLCISLPTLLGAYLYLGSLDYLD